MTVRLIKKLKKLRLRLFTYKPLPRKSLHMRTTIVRNRDSKTTRPAWANLALDKGNIDWGGAGTIYHTYQFLIWPLAAVIVIAGVIAYAVRNS